MKLLNSKGFIPIVALIAILIISSTIYLATKAPFKLPNLVKSASKVQAQSVGLPSATIQATSTPSAQPINVPTVAPTPVPTIAPTPQPVSNNTPPSSGYQRQVVSVEGQSYPVDIMAADLNSTKVIVDTASDSDCANNCPVMNLADYATRNRAYAAINGSFFCPADYASCAGKVNSFDTLLMNKNKHYFNSDNNVYSVIPAAIFFPGGARFVGRSMEWGRDTSPDSVIANYPLLVAGGNVTFNEDPNEPKFGQKGYRSFVAVHENMVYIGVIRNATMGEAAKVLHAMGMSEALNLDEGGSTAFWVGGSYIAGPGRNIPNALLFIKR